MKGAYATRKLLAWRKKRIAKVTEQPPYHSLPQALLWPNPEVSLMIVFSCGLVEAACAILGALAGGYDMSPTHVALACIALSMVLAFDVSQMRQLVHFYRVHMSVCWTYQDHPSSRSQIEDPLLALVCRLRLIRPRNREQGAFDVPGQEASEPQRTELALAEAFSCGFGFQRRIARFLFHRKLGHYVQYDRDTPGHSLERLQGLLCDGVATRLGILFQVVQVAVQLTIAVHTGIVFSRGASPSTQITLMSVNLGCQTLGAIFTASFTANDLWNGAVVACVFALEASASCCLLWSMVLMHHDTASDAKQHLNATINATHLDNSAQQLRVSRAVQLAADAATLLQAAIFLPLSLIVYDSMVVPVVNFIWRVDAGSPLELLCSFLTALVVVPMMLAKSFLTVGVSAKVVADVADASDQFGGCVSDVMTSAEGSSEVCTEQASSCSGGANAQEPQTNT